MSLKLKLSLLVLMVCGLLTLFAGYLLWHSWQIRVSTDRFLPSLSYLCSISDARSWMTRQVKDGLDYLILEVTPESSQYSRAAHQVAASFTVWQEAIRVQQGLGIPGENDDLELVEQIRQRYQQWHDGNQELFSSLPQNGRPKTLRRYVDLTEQGMNASVFVLMDKALDDGLDEVDEGYRSLLLAMGSAPWTARIAEERLQLTKSTIEYLVATSELSAAVNRQICSLMDDLCSDSPDSHHKYLLMQQRTLLAYDALVNARLRREQAGHVTADPYLGPLQETMLQVQNLADEIYLGHQNGLSLDDLHQRSEYLEQLLDAKMVPCLLRTLQQGSSEMRELTRTPYGWLVGIFAVSCGIFAVLSMQLIRNLFAALMQLQRGMGLIAEGNYSHRIGMNRDDELGMLAGTFDDMAGRLERTRRELEDLYRGMEQRVQERTQQLELANQELESFNYSVSHDLRGALTQVSGLTQLLMVEGKNMPAAEIQGYRERICHATARMARTISGLMDLAKLSGRSVAHLPVDLSAIVQDVAAELQDRDPKRQVQFRIAPNVVVLGDDTLLRLAMENLLGNAWKYTAGKTIARIEFGVTPGNGQIRCYLSDNGIGFDETAAGTIFTPFVRLDNAAGFAGEGVGLATVRRIITYHGGTISAKGAPDGGATFTFTLDAPLSGR